MKSSKWKDDFFLIKEFIRPLSWAAKAPLVGGIVAIIGQTIFLVAGASTLGLMIERGLVQRDIQAMILGLAVTVTLQVSSALLAAYGRILLAQGSLKSIEETRAKAFQSVCALPFSVIDDMRSGNIASVLTTEIESLDTALRDALGRAVQTSIHLTVLLTAAFAIDSTLALVMLLGSVPAFLISSKVMIPLKGAQRRSFEADGKFASELVELTSGWETILGIGAKHWATNRLKKTLQLATDCRMSANKIESCLGALLPTLCYLPLMGVVWVVLGGRSSGVSLGIGVAFLRLAQQVVFPVQMLAGEFQSVQTVVRALERIQGLFHSIQRPMHPREQIAHAGSFEELIVDKLSLSYGSHLSLSGVNIKIKRGDVVGLIGPSGSGKTSLVRAILGAYPHQSGDIFWNGLPVSKIEAESLGEQIAYAASDALWFPGSLLENVAFGRDVSVVEMKKVFELFGFSSQTTIVRSSSEVSLEERQLVQLARVLLSSSSLVILDEATSSLTTERELELLTKVLEFGRGKTFIIISHRPTPLVLCGKVISLSKGRVLPDSADVYRSSGVASQAAGGEVMTRL